MSGKSGSSSTRSVSTRSVGCVLVNYRSPWEMLSHCLDSIYEDGGASGVEVTVTVVDNGSGDGVIDRVRSRYSGATIVTMPSNAGFAAAVNRGLAEVGEPSVLLLNTDAVLVPGALAEMLKVLGDAGDSVAGVAPKMLLSAHPGVIDAVGTVMPPSGASFNRGIGQCDLGQYDAVEEVAGVCFGAALLKRDLFDKRQVGPLYEDYFLYFEDSDWCLRAAGQGYRFLTAPGAVVMHMHSGVARHESLAFKYRLIELNTLKLVLRNFEGPLALKIVAARSSRLLARTLIRRRFVRANLSTLGTFTRELPRLLRERRQLRLKKRVTDDRLFRLASEEAAFFDTVAYRPDRCLDSLIATYQRLLDSSANPEAGRLLASLNRVRGRLAQQRPALSREDEELFAGQPQCVRELLAIGVAAGKVHPETG